MKLCDTTKGISCYSFYTASFLQIIISIYFSILCLKGLKVYKLTAQKYPRITRIHFLKQFTLLIIIIIEIISVSIGLDWKEEDEMDASQVFNSIVNITSEVICMILLRKEFTTLKFTSGYMRSYILLSFFIYTIAIMINAFNNKSSEFGLSTNQILYVTCLAFKFTLTIEVFFHKSDLIKNQSPSYEEDDDAFEITGEGKSDDLYFNLQEHHIEIDVSNTRNNNIQKDVQQITYPESNEQNTNMIYYSKHQYHSHPEQNLIKISPTNQQAIRTAENYKSQLMQSNENEPQKGKQSYLAFRNSNQILDNNNNSQIKGSFNHINSLNSALLSSSKVAHSSHIPTQTAAEERQINHLFIQDIYNSDGNVMIKIKIKYVSGQSCEFNRSLQEFQQIATFIRNYLKHEDSDLVEIEETDLNLRFQNVQEEEAFMRKLEKAMNLIIINNFHTNVNIINFFDTRVTNNASSEISQFKSSESQPCSVTNQYLIEQNESGDYIIEEEQKRQRHQNIQAHTDSIRSSNCKQNNKQFESGEYLPNKSNNNNNNRNSNSNNNNNNNNDSQVSNQVSISIQSMSSSINDDLNEINSSEKSSCDDIIIKVKQITTEYIPVEDYTYFTNAGVKDYIIETRYKEILMTHNNIKEALPKIEIPELPFKEKTMDIFKSKTDQDVIDFRRKTLPFYFETILNNKQIQKIRFIKETFFL